MTKQFIHADGHSIWGRPVGGCLRAEDGSIEMSIGQSSTSLMRSRRANNSPSRNVRTAPG